MQAAISRYLVEVATYLGGRTPDQRRELLADLESHIHEALARRGHEPTLDDLEAVLAEMAPPESYAAGQEAQVSGLQPAPVRESRSTMASWALALAIGGLVVPVALAAILMSLNPRGEGGAVMILFPLLELLALVLGILAWKEPLGKAAVVLAASLLLLVGGATAFMWFYKNASTKSAELRNMTKEASTKPVESRNMTRDSDPTNIIVAPRSTSGSASP